eukprot:2803574-Rhodomonas_salina.1
MSLSLTAALGRSSGDFSRVLWMMVWCGARQAKKLEKKIPEVEAAEKWRKGKEVCREQEDDKKKAEAAAKKEEEVRKKEEEKQRAAEERKRKEEEQKQAAAEK